MFAAKTVSIIVFFMTYEKFEEFVKSEKTFMAYQQDLYIIRVVKVPLTENVQALYANCTYNHSDGDKPYSVSLNEKMEAVGFIDHKGDFCFPTHLFIHYMVDYPNEIVMKDRNKAVAQVIEAAVDKMARATPLPEWKENDNAAYYRACERLFSGDKDFRIPVHNDFSYYIKDDVFVDFLADTPNWAEKIAQKWASDFAFNRGNEIITNLDMYREDIAFAHKVDEIAKTIMADKSHKLHRYIAMRDAVKDIRTVVVDFRTSTGEIGEAKIPADTFRHGTAYSLSKIPLYEITPRRESRRVAELLPKMSSETGGYEYYANELPKDRIVAIKYRGQIIWEENR